MSKVPISLHPPVGKNSSVAVLPELTFFGVVRQKLKWSGSTI
jgi:hypothetical protein